MCTGNNFGRPAGKAVLSPATLGGVCAAGVP